MAGKDNKLEKKKKENGQPKAYYHYQNRKFNNRIKYTKIYKRELP